MLEHSGSNPKIHTQLAALTFSRILINTAVRMVYPFLPVFSRAFGVPTETLVLLVSARSALTVGAPLFGGLSDRFGNQNILYAALAIFILSMISVLFFPGFYSFAFAMLLVIVAKIIFDPAAFSFLSERIPYARRGFFIGIYELSWSISFFAGMPVVGWLLAIQYQNSWQFPFILLGILCVLNLLIFWKIQSGGQNRREQSNPQKKLPVKWKNIFRDRYILLILCIGMLLCMAQENVLVIMGIWLEKDFGLTITSLGLSSLVIGIAELTAEGGVIGIIDRFGKRRSIRWGAVLNIVAFSLLPVISSSVLGALAGLFLVFFAFEFTFVATLPFVTELLPNARSQVISLYISLQWIGRSFGALAGGFLFEAGILWNGIFGALASFAAWIIITFNRDPNPIINNNIE